MLGYQPGTKMHPSSPLPPILLRALPGALHTALPINLCIICRKWAWGQREELEHLQRSVGSGAG